MKEKKKKKKKSTRDIFSLLVTERRKKRQKGRESRGKGRRRLECSRSIGEQKCVPWLTEA